MQIGFLNLIIRITLKYTQVCQIRKIKLLPGNYRFLAIKGADRK